MEEVWLDEERIAAQPIRLSAGNHSSPFDGVCVVELASLIADEEFSDSPECVCPVIGSFLRAWNDRAGYHERQKLEPYARRIVGSRGGRDVTRRRRDLCLAYAGTRQRARIALYCGVEAGLKLNQGAGEFAARVAFANGDSAGAFGLLEAMLAVGAKPGAPRVAPPAPRLEAAPLPELVASPPQMRVPAGIG
jgi:hypothetical protein